MEKRHSTENLQHTQKVISEQRRAKISDITEISDLMMSIPELKIDNDLPFTSPEELEYCIRNKKGIFLVYVKNDKIIGFLYGTLDTPETACIVYIGVYKDYRHDGIGRCLIRKFITEINKFPVSKVYALSTNDVARKFFLRCGLQAHSTLIYHSANINNLWRVV